MSSGSSTGTWLWAFTVPISPSAKSRFITKAAAVGHLHCIFGVTNCTTQSRKLLNDTMSSPLSTTRSASAPFQPWTPLAIFGLLHQQSCIAAEQLFMKKKNAGRRLLHHTQFFEIFHRNPCHRSDSIFRYFTCLHGTRLDLATTDNAEISTAQLATISWRLQHLNPNPKTY